MRLDDIPIRVKLPMTIGVGLFLFAGVVLFYTLTLRQTIGGYENLLAHGLQIQQTARTVTIEMLQARRMEKDFLSRRDPALLEAVAQRITRAKQAAREIRRLSEGTSIAQEVARRMMLVDHLEQYLLLIQEIGADWRAKGLTHLEGSQGAFRQAARTLEEAMTRLERSGDGEEEPRPRIVARLEAMVDYLSMRRMEKDYLLRQEEEHAAGVERFVAVLGERLQRVARSPGEQEQVGKRLEEYRLAFRALVTLDQGIEEKMNRLRDEIHRVEPLTDEIENLAARLAADESAATRQEAEQSAQWIFLASLLTILACGLLSMRMVRGLVRSISDLSHFARKVADGNLDATTTLSGGDETGHLASVMREMVNRMRAIRLIADRMVVILALIGRGAIPEPLEVEFHGDFKKITDALNDLIHRLRAIRQIASGMDRISRGEIPDKVDGEFQGDFRRIQEAMNVMIDKLREIGGLPAAVS